MTKKRNLEPKENYEIVGKCEAFYTGGKIQFTKSGEQILSICDGNLKLFNITDGKTADAIEKFEGEEIISFLLAEDDETLVTAAKNGIMRHFNLKSKLLLKTWKTVHVGLVNCMAFDKTTTLLATGGSDSTVKVWDIVNKYYTHNLKGAKGVFSKVCIQELGSEDDNQELGSEDDNQELDSEYLLFGAADDYLIHVWNLGTKERVASLSGHFSTITDFVFEEKSKRMFSCSRDKVVLVWDIKTLKLLKTIPVFETVESCFLTPQKLSLPNVSFNEADSYFITAGDKGVLKVWSTRTAKPVFEQNDSLIVLPEDSNYEGPLIVQALFVPSLEAIAVVTFEQNVILYSLDNLTVKKQFVGYNDDILSIKFIGSKDSQIAVATNSSQVKLFQLPSFNAQLLKGHSDIVLSLDVFPKHKNLLVSGSKDNNVKVWEINSKSSSINSVYTGYGHTDSVTAVCCCKSKSRFFASGSEDTTLKMWEVPDKKPLVALKLLLTPYCTVKAHDKLINCIDISENDQFVASGSQDHTAKIWQSSDLTHLGTLRGHRKGVWCVKFSPVDLAVATSSGDETIRVWSLVDFSCLKVFEGHESTVLQVLFLSRGTQLISSASDGNIKLWDIKNNLCLKTFDEHASKVWTLATSASEEYLVSGGGDSNVILWKDVTKIDKETKMAEIETYVLQEQELRNLVHEEKWTKALGLAITLDKPFQAFTIITEILQKKENYKNGEILLGSVLESLRQDQREALLKFSIEWITNSKTYYPAILVMNFFYRTYDSEELLKVPQMYSYIQASLPYIDRHFKRIQEQCRDMQILTLSLHQMGPE